MLYNILYSLHRGRKLNIDSHFSGMKSVLPSTDDFMKYRYRKTQN